MGRARERMEVAERPRCGLRTSRQDRLCPCVWNDDDPGRVGKCAKQVRTARSNARKLDHEDETVLEPGRRPTGRQ